MTLNVKIRLAIFLTLAVVGITYIGGTYLGLVDKVLGRGVTVSMELPASGGLYVGSEVDYRGVKVGRVSGMHLTPKGVRVEMALHPGARVPRSAQIQVANLSAVGEQYVNFLPTSTAGPYLRDGDQVDGAEATLPPSTDRLLTSLDSFTASVNPADLRTVVNELGDMFRGNAENLRTLVDGASEFVGEAIEHQEATISMLNAGGQVLRTQQAHADDIRTFARGLKDVTAALKSSDPTLRSILQGGSAAMKQVQSLVDGLDPLLPVFISNLVTTNQVLTARLPAVEQVLVTFPVVVKNGLIGTPGDGYGHINLQFSYTAPVCTQGYMPPNQWALPSDLSKGAAYPAKCTDKRAQPDYSGPDPIVQRGVNMAPQVDDSAPIFQVDPYASLKRRSAAAEGSDVTIVTPDTAGQAASNPASGDAGTPAGETARGPLSILGTSAWQSMLIGPVTRGQ